MQVILLERVEKLGQMGEEVRVKDGFARNFLLPKKKALRATKANREFFQTQKTQLEANNLRLRGEDRSRRGQGRGRGTVRARRRPQGRRSRRGLSASADEIKRPGANRAFSFPAIYDLFR